MYIIEFFLQSSGDATLELASAAHWQFCVPQAFQVLGKAVAVL